ncbi:MAG TPA: hypothetical protein VFE13_20285, partial [Caulobacteraceae bacterium]|nr:hypothetical protein [Caulobacteraceae bacterium]
MQDVARGGRLRHRLTVADRVAGSVGMAAQGAGVSLAGPAGRVTVNPVQTTTYQLNSSTNPITFGASTNIKVTTTGAAAVEGGTARYVIDNQGYLRGSYFGVELAGGGKVTNSGTILGGRRSITIAAHGTVSNSGRITGSVEIGQSGVVANSGTIGNYSAGSPIFLDHGGSLTNDATGRIYGGVYSKAGQLTFSNAGYVYSNGTGLSVHGGASITNAAGATVFGQSEGMHVYRTSQAVTITNAGQIGGGMDSRSVGVEIDADNVVFNNLATGQVNAPADGAMKITGEGVIVTNAGRIAANSNFGPGIIAAGDTIVNLSGGDIFGYFEAVSLGGGGSLTNAGVIESQSTVGVTKSGKGSIVNKAGGAITGKQFGLQWNGGADARLVNFGSIVGQTLTALTFNASGSVSNWATGSITGSSGVQIGALGAQLINAGVITGKKTTGVVFTDGAVMTNRVGGVVSGKQYGVSVTGTAGATIINAGKISGEIAAINFANVGANKLTLQTGAELVGKVIGSTASGATNTLVLQGAGLADNAFQNFGALQVQGPGVWTLDASGAFGTLSVGGGTLQVGDATHTATKITFGGAVFNKGVISVAGGVLSFVQKVTGTGSAAIAGGTLAFASTFEEAVAFTGSGVLQLGASQLYHGTIGGFAVGDTLDLRDIGFASGATTATFTDDG